MASTMKGGAASPSGRLDRADWLGLALFLAPIAVATASWLAGGL